MSFVIPRLIASVALLAVCMTAAAAEIEAKGSLICGIFETHECVSGNGCERIQPEEINIRTRFLTVDFAKKEIRAHKTERKTKIGSVKEVGNKLVIAGAESGVNLEQDGVGYSLTISKDSGSMTLSATGDDVAFVVFGACTAN